MKILILLLTFAVLGIASAEEAKCFNGDITGNYGYKENNFCMVLPDGYVGKDSPGTPAINISLGECGKGSIFYRLNKGGIPRHAIKNAINERIGIRVRDKRSLGVKPLSIRLYPVALSLLPIESNREGVQFSYYDYNWKVDREEVVVFIEGYSGLHEFVLFSTREEFSQHKKLFDNMLLSLRNQSCETPNKAIKKDV